MVNFGITVILGKYSQYLRRKETVFLVVEALQVKLLVSLRIKSQERVLWDISFLSILLVALLLGLINNDLY